jgi:hypothetical protein
MKKLSSKEEKALLYMFKKGYDLSLICSTFNLCQTYVQRLYKCYKTTGSVSFTHDTRTLSLEEKVRAVVAVAEKSLTLFSASIKYNLPHSTLHGWLRIYQRTGLKGLTYLLEVQMKKKKQPISVPPSGKKYTEEYVKELEYKLLKAEAEIAFLKKLRALTQADKRR